MKRRYQKLCSATLSISKHTFCQHTRYTFIQYWVGNALQGNFKYGCFWLFCDRRETLLPCFDSYFSRQKRKKTRLTVVFTLIYYVTDFMTVSMRTSQPVRMTTSQEKPQIYSVAFPPDMSTMTGDGRTGLSMKIFITLFLCYISEHCTTARTLNMTINHKIPQTR